MTDHRSAFDHLVLNVGAGLDAAQKAYARLGFQLTERGHHTLGTSNHLAIFQGNYFELLGFQAGSAAANNNPISARLGLSAIALRAGHSETLHAELTARGIAAAAPQSFSRPVAVDGRLEDARFTIVRLEAEPSASPRLFFCEHLTPELVYRSEWQEHPNGVQAITHLVMAAADPEEASRPFLLLAGPDRASVSSTGATIGLGSVTLDIVRPAEAARRFGGADLPTVEGAAGLVGIVLRTSSLERLRTALQRGGITPSYDAADQVIVGAREACGALLAFTPSG